jgi:hypothetical protein
LVSVQVHEGDLQGLKSTGSTRGRDSIARKVDHEQKTNLIYKMLKPYFLWFWKKYWHEAGQTSVAATRKQNHFTGPSDLFHVRYVWDKQLREAELCLVMAQCTVWWRHFDDPDLSLPAE